MFCSGWCCCQLGEIFISSKKYSSGSPVPFSIVHYKDYTNGVNGHWTWWVWTLAKISYYSENTDTRCVLESTLVFEVNVL